MLFPWFVILYRDDFLWQLFLPFPIFPTNNNPHNILREREAMTKSKKRQFTATTGMRGNVWATVNPPPPPPSTPINKLGGGPPATPSSKSHNPTMASSSSSGSNPKRKRKKADNFIALPSSSNAASAASAAIVPIKVEVAPNDPERDPIVISFPQGIQISIAGVGGGGGCVSALPLFECSKPRLLLPLLSSRGMLVRGKDNHCAYLALATTNSNARPSNAQGNDNIDGIKRKGEEMAHNNA